MSAHAALRDYAEQAENGGGFQRRLFAEDTVRGFAFIDLCRKRYDVVLMNPPFGDASLRSKPYLDDTYGDTPTDSKSNTWTQLTSYTQTNVRVRLWYCVPTSVASSPAATGTDSLPTNLRNLG